VFVAGVVSWELGPTEGTTGHCPCRHVRRCDKVILSVPQQVIDDTSLIYGCTFNWLLISKKVTVFINSCVRCLDTNNCLFAPFKRIYSFAFRYCVVA